MTNLPQCSLEIQFAVECGLRVSDMYGYGAGKYAERTPKTKSAHSRVPVHYLSDFSATLIHTVFELPPKLITNEHLSDFSGDCKANIVYCVRVIFLPGSYSQTHCCLFYYKSLLRCPRQYNLFAFGERMIQQCCTQCRCEITSSNPKPTQHHPTPPCPIPAIPVSYMPQKYCEQHRL